MAATTANIAINSVNAIADIAINSVGIIEADHWNGTTLNQVWAKGGSSATWIQNTSGFFSLTEYTPSVNMNVASFSRRMAEVNQSYSTNWAIGIYTKSGTGYPYTATPVTNSTLFGSWTGVSFVFEQVYLSKNQYKITKSYSAGSRPALTAGTTYYFVMGERYPPNPYFTLSGTYSCAYTDDWRVSASSAFDVTTSSSNLFYLEVVPE